VNAWKESIEDSSEFQVGGVMGALKKFKFFNDQLSNERRLKNQISYLQQFQNIEIQSYFFNKIGIILKLGKLLILCK
jgi:hypothetical protein